MYNLKIIEPVSQLKKLPSVNLYSIYSKVFFSNFC